MRQVHFLVGFVVALCASVVLAEDRSVSPPESVSLLDSFVRIDSESPVTFQWRSNAQRILESYSSIHQPFGGANDQPFGGSFYRRNTFPRTDFIIEDGRTGRRSVRRELDYPMYGIVNYSLVKITQDPLFTFDWTLESKEALRDDELVRQELQTLKDSSNRHFSRRALQWRIPDLKVSPDGLISRNDMQFPKEHFFLEPGVN